MNTSRAQIVATIGPASEGPKILKELVTHHVDAVRFNFSWGKAETRTREIAAIQRLGEEIGRHIPIIVDVPGPRVQEEGGHTYDSNITSAITEHDEACIRFAIKHNVDYVALSFVGSAQDIQKGRDIIKAHNGTQKIIAKIERAVALEALEEIINASDAVMVARGDLSKEIPFEQMPFVQERIVQAAKKAGKPVIVATSLLLSMTENKTPTRAEVTDVTNAILQGADAIMLSEETAQGKYPIEAVAAMEKIAIEAEMHEKRQVPIHPL
ncbi:MAG: pyruvate kinase [Patescibacteria group bacterium]